MSMGRLSPSAVAILRLLFLFCVVVAVGHAKVEELWRVPLGLSLSPVSADPLVTVTSDTYFAANDRGTIFAFSADGRQLWSAPGNDTLAALMSAPGAGDVLLAGYATDSLQPAVIQALDGKSGAPLWNRTLSFLHSSGSIYLIDSYRKAFVFAVPGTEGYTITSYDLRTGAIRWTQIVLASFIGNLFVTESVILVAGFFNTLGAVTLSPASGDVICNFSSPEFLFFSLGGNVVFSHPTVQTYLLYDATTCAVLANFTSPELLLEPFGTPTHMLLFASAAPSSECDLLVYSANGALQWNITLPISETPNAFYASVPVAGFDGDVLYVSWAGILSAYNATTGATLWSTAPTAVPVAPNPSPAIPLDHGRVFVPNLQGYVLFDANVQRVLEVNVQQPLSAPLVSHRADGSAVVVVGELGSGDLVALTERWDPVQTVWEVPLAIGPVPAASAVVAAQDALNYYVADPRGVIFALDAASGRVLWSSPGAGGLTGLQTLAAFPDRVFALMPGAVLALSATDGTVLWNVSASLGPNSFFAGMLLTEPALLMLTVELASTLPVLTGYSPLTGAQLWTMNLDGWQGEFPVVASNEIGFIQTLIEDQPTFLQSFNLTTGAMHCATNVCGDVAGVYGELAVLRYGVPYCGDTVFSGASCATAKNLTTAFGGNFVFGASSLGLFVLNQTEDGQTLLSRVGMWSTAVPVPMPPPSTLHVARSPSDPSALVFGVAGYFGEVDAESGTLRWSGTAREPFMTSAVSPLPVFPLDRSTVFVASGSGYAVYDPSSQMTTAVVSDSPLAAVGFFVAPPATTAPLVVFVDLASGAVKAVASNP